MPLANLPHELIQDIIEHERGDAHALASCSLVARSWRHTSQRELFYNFKVYVDSNVVSADFLDFLAASLNVSDDSLCAPVARYIRHLTIRSSGKQSGAFFDGTCELARVLEVAPHLKTLTLEGLRISFYGQQGSPGSRRLERISFKDVLGVAVLVEQMFCSLPTFCMTKALHVSGVSFEVPGTFRDTPVHGLACIETFTLRSRYVPVFVLRFFPRCTLKNLDVACNQVADVHQLGDFFESSGSSLEHVGVDLSRYLVKVPYRTFSSVFELFPSSTIP